MVINNVKFKTLREPLVFSDFFLYLQAIQHPRLYFPFLGVLPIILVVFISVLLIFGFIFEKPVIDYFSLESLFLLVLAFSGIVLVKKACLSVSIEGEPETDCRHYGVLSVLFIYSIQAKLANASFQEYLLDSSPLKKPDIKNIADLPDVIIVQSESFFDARNMDKNIRQDVLTNYDRALRSANAHGKLEVPAWGANTMRSEFAFLTGYTAAQLGLAKFYPYQQLSTFEIPSLVGHLKALGYHTVCIHPNAASFFKRDTFFKKIGFDRFIDEDQFQEAIKVGPYIADSEVTKKIKEALQLTDGPCFIFAITMENHGPLHLEKTSNDAWKKYFNTKPQQGLEDLTVYLKHLKNADLMIHQLLSFFHDEKKTIVGFYGDHVPAISKIFSFLDYEDPRSNYFLWDNFGVPLDGTEKCTDSKSIKIETLAAHVLNLINSD